MEKLYKEMKLQFIYYDGNGNIYILYLRHLRGGWKCQWCGEIAMMRWSSEVAAYIHNTKPREEKYKNEKKLK